MTFVYSFVSKDSLEQKMKEQARTIAVKRLGRIGHSMKLEEQGLLKEDQESSLNDLIDQILIEKRKNFWD